MQKIVIKSLLCLSLLTLNTFFLICMNRNMSKENIELADAVFDNNIDKAKEAISNGAQVNSIDTRGFMGFPLLFIAVSKAHAAFKGISSDVQDQRLKILELLLQNKANVNSTLLGESALELILDAPNAKIIKMLLTYGADIYHKGKDGQTFVEKAKNMNPGIKDLVENYVNLLERVQTNPYNKQTLQDAIKDDYHVLVLNLLNQGAPVDENDLKLAKDFGSEISGRIIFNRLRLTCPVGGISKTGLLKVEPQLPQEIWQKIIKFTH